MWINRRVIRKKLKSGNMFQHQRIVVALKTTSNITRHFKSSAVPLYHSLVTFLIDNNIVLMQLLGMY